MLINGMKTTKVINMLCWQKKSTLFNRLNKYLLYEREFFLNGLGNTADGAGYLFGAKAVLKNDR